MDNITNEYLNKVIKSICKIDINKLFEDLSTKKKEVFNLKEQLIHSKNANDSKSSQIVKLESEISNQKGVIHTLQSLNEEYSSKIKSSRADIDSLKKERNELTSGITKKLRIINELNLQKIALQDQLNQTKLALQKANQEYTRLQEYTDQLLEECSVLKGDIQNISKEKDVLLNNVTELQNHIAENDKEIKQLKEKNTQTTATNEKLLRKQTHLYEENSAIRAEKKKLLQKIEEERVSGEQQREEQGQAIESLLSEKNTLITQVGALQKDIAYYESKVKTLEDRNDQLSVSNEELLRKQTHLYEENSIIRAEKEELSQKLEEERVSGEQQREEQSQTIESLLTEKNALITQVGALQKDTVYYESKVKTLEDRNNQLSVSNEELLRKQTHLHEENSIINEEKNSPLLQVEEEIQINGQQIEGLSQTIEKESAEEFFSGNKNETFEENQVESITDGNAIDDKILETVNISAEIDLQKDAIDSEVDEDESSEVYGQNVSDESSLLSSPEVVDVNIDDVSISSTENKTKDEQNEILTDVAKLDDIEENKEEQDDDSHTFFYDHNLIPADKLSIPEVYDVKEAKIINARDFFSQNESELILWRRNIQEEYLMGHARFICPECKQPIKISGHKLARGRVCYFAHFKDSDDCSYKTGSQKSKEEIERLKYALVQESDRHKRLKTAIASALKGEQSQSMGVENVECEKRINSDIPYLNWRRPDIYAEYNGRKYVFELQLSTTFVSVVVDRDIFYRLNNYNIIWVFNFEDNTEYVNLHNLMCKDIYYANKRNVFIFDSDAEERSRERGELVLKCRWLDEDGKWSNDQYITLDMLQYDEENHKPFIVDADKAYLEKYPEYVVRRKQLEHSREYLLKALMERHKYEEEIEKRKNKERSNLQMELLENDKCVERFRSGTKYGYLYQGTTILPAKYTKADEFHENKYAQVGFNRKIGLVRKDGKEIVPVEYKNIDIINSEHGIVMASYKRIDLFLADEIFPLINEYDDKEQKIIKEEENKITKYILRTNKYKYFYTSSYYGNHPICHKESAGYSNTILFSVTEGNNFCIIFIQDKTYLLSKNRLSCINGNYSDLMPTGIDLILIAKDSSTDLWGVIDFQGNVITNFEYTELIPTESEYLIARFSKEITLYGIIDYLGRKFMMPQFEALIYLNSERFAFRKGRLWGICDRLGNILQDAEYTYIRGMSSDRIMGSRLEAYAMKWEVKDNIPLYIDENVKLCLLDEMGSIVFSEQEMGQYFIRRSGDLYSILTQDKVELVTYSLSEVMFIDKGIALIKDFEGIPGFFIDEKCIFFEGCKNIEQLGKDVFKFEGVQGTVAIGNYTGPVCDYIYSDIKNVDSDHYIASSKKQELWNSSLSYVIIDKGGCVLSVAFSRIDEFKNGLASAIYQGRKGVIDVNGVMQEEIVDNYGEYLLCVEFEYYYFRNKENGLKSEKFQRVDNLFGLFFAVKKRLADNFKLYSLEENKMTDSEFERIFHLTGNLFVAEKLGTGYYQGNFQLYKKLNPVFAENYFSILLLDNGYIAIQKRSVSGSGLKWIILKDDCSVLNDKEYDLIKEANNSSFKVAINGNEGLIDLNGDAIVEKEQCSNGFVRTSCFGDNGLEDKDGNVICALEEHFSSIEFMDENRLKICKNGKYALYAINGTPITEHRFSSISYEEANRYKVFEDGIKGYINSHGDYIETSILSIAEDGSVIFILREKYGLRKTDGKVILPAEFSSIEFIEGNLLKTCKDNKFALYSVDGNPITEHKFTLIAYESANRYKVIEDKIKGHINSHGEYIETYKKSIAEDGTTIFVLRGKYGLRSAAGNIIIPAEYTSIKYLVRRLLVVKKGSFVALFNFEGEPLTEFKYLSISCEEDGVLHAKRNNLIGQLDDKGNELTYDKYFNGGCVKSSFGDYFVTNEEGDVIIPIGNSKIEILDDDGVLALWNINKVAIWNSKKVTKPMYSSAKSIGNGFFVVSKMFYRKIREKRTRYITDFLGWRTPQNYYTTKIIKDEKFGIVDMNLRTIIPCKYSSISNFDDEQNIITTDLKNGKKIITLNELKKKTSIKIELSIEEENVAIVKSFMPIGLVVKIHETSYVIHKKYLFKSKQEFKKGESIIVKYLGDDQDCYPIWGTKMIPSEEQNP